MYHQLRLIGNCGIARIPDDVSVRRSRIQPERLPKLGCAGGVTSGSSLTDVAKVTAKAKFTLSVQMCIRQPSHSICQRGDC